MEVKDQLGVRMEQLHVSINELATRVGVSQQSVRHWLKGRSFPGKRRTRALEDALSFHLDYSEGAGEDQPTAVQLMDQQDVEIFRDIAKLPPEMKHEFARLARSFVERLH